MKGRQDALHLLERVLTLSRAGQAEVSYTGEVLDLTRFNDNAIHQNLRRRTAGVSVRVVMDKRVGIASTSELDDSSLRRAVERAEEAASLQEPNPEFISLPSPAPVPELNSFIRATAAITPEERADHCGAVVSVAEQKGLSASGTYSTKLLERAVANSLGVRAYECATEAFMRTIMNSGENTGYGDMLSRDVRDIDPQGIAREAALKATLKQHPRDLPVGEYDTFFEEYAVADLIRFFGYIAFGANAVQEGRSFLAGAMGTRVLGPNVSIWDDGTDERGLVRAFDSEGVPKQRVSIIENGVARGPVYDSYTAHREGRASTGHAGESWSGYRSGPTPANMFLGDGGVTKAEMLRGIDRGVLVTRFHYTHAPEPMRVVATGTTRDGTFLVEKGEVVARLRNLRFTQSLIDAFNRVEGVSDTVRITRDWWSSFAPVLPALRIAGFSFTGGTSF